MGKLRIHTYPLSRLVFAPATDWLRILDELKSGRKQMYWSYKPLRMGALRLLKAKDAQREGIYREVGDLAEKAGGAKCASANLRALQVFEDRFLPMIGSPKANLMDRGLQRVDFASVELVGGPHFSVVDKSGETRFVYLHPSTWSQDESEAFCELLTIVIEKEFQGEAGDLWFLDLRSGKRLPWPKSKIRLRRRCEQAAKLLTRLRAANLEEAES